MSTQSLTEKKIKATVVSKGISFDYIFWITGTMNYYHALVDQHRRVLNFKNPEITYQVIED